MKTKKINLIFCFIIIFILALAFVSANEVCCGKIKDGAWCQMAESGNCVPEYGMAPTSCDATTYCKLGTCVNENKGTCMQNTPKVRCELEQGAHWDFHSVDEIGMCQNGCCLFGEDAAFVTKTECKQIAYDYGIEISFREDINEEFTCYAMAHTKEEGACVFEEDFSTTCKRLTKEECSQVPESSFQPGFLCTAPQLETDCAATENTKCHKSQVYFLDSCRNLANVYDEAMFAKNNWNKKMRDYWTYIQEPECVIGYAPFSSSCGNCNEILGTICKEYKSGQQNMPSKPKYGDYVCADMGCYYDTNNDGNEERYEHGEAWCAESEGIFPHVQVDPDTLEFKNEDILMALGNSTKYNLPGSRYHKLMCFDGEVVVEPCKDYRNEICVEYVWGEENEQGEQTFQGAECVVNLWRDCYSQTNQESCETQPRYCKWINGYRFDGQKVTTSEDTKQDNSNKTENTQGSCVPLYSPGFDFWESNNDGIAICSMASVMEPAVYETGLFRSRERFEEQPTCDTDSNKDAVQRCFQNCYVIPDYGRESESKDYFTRDKLKSVHDGASLGSKFENYCISDRRGYYCEEKTGEVGGPKANCIDDHHSNYPIFFTHEEWISSIRTRARSLGDCGYKAGAFFELSEISPELEVVSAIFQKLKQKGEVKKESESEKIYVGDEEVWRGEGKYRPEN